MNEISSLPSLSDLLTQNPNLKANQQLDRFAQNSEMGQGFWGFRNTAVQTELILYRLIKPLRLIVLPHLDFRICSKVSLKELIKRKRFQPRETQDLILGRSDNIHEAVVKSQEAGVATFNLMIEVRNKLVESYKELMRMQV